MTIKIDKQTLRKPFNASIAIAGLGTLTSIIGYNYSFQAGTIGAVIAVAGLTSAAVINKLFQKIFGQAIYNDLLQVEDIIEVENEGS